MKKPKTQYRIASNGWDFHIQRLETTWFGLRKKWEDIWSHGGALAFDNLNTARSAIADYICQDKKDTARYISVSEIIS
jgi:hypothetical protein